MTSARRRPRGSLPLLAVSLVLAVACAGPPVPPRVLDPQGASRWHRVEGEHFVVEGNLDDPAALRRLAGDFETLWYALAAVPVLGLQPPEVRPLVVVLGDEAEFRYLFGEAYAGVFFHETWLGPLILMPAHRGPFGETVVKHELAHFISSEFLPDAPRWLAEGLAQVVETAEYDTRNGEVIFGDHSPELLHGASFRLPLSTLTNPWPDLDSVSPRTRAALYGRSWALVHFLIDHHLQPFLDLLVRVSHGEPWREAWDGSLPLWRRHVDEELDRYLRRGRFETWRVVAHLPAQDDLALSPIAPADALALRALLLTHTPVPSLGAEQVEAAAGRDLEQALQLDPRNARVAAILAAAGVEPGEG